MGFEIELKAHVREDQVDYVLSAISALPSAKSLGPISKFDMYWSQTDEGEPIFRVRREMTADGPDILFTAKPNKVKTEKGTEENQELEFTASDNQWDNILNFCSGIGLQVCRLKWKKGKHFHVMYNGFDVHAEVLDVKYLGWFLEMEICPESSEGFDIEGADRALRSILAEVGISEDAVESRGYNRMLKAIGHNKG